MKITTLILLPVLLLTGCATALKVPPPAVVAAAKFDPVPADIEARIKAQYTVILKDPYSAVYSFGVPRRCYFETAAGKLFGYAIPVTVNAKNSYGGYVGGQLYYWAWSGGNLYNCTLGVRFGGVAFID